MKPCGFSLAMLWHDQKRALPPISRFLKKIETSPERTRPLEWAMVIAKAYYESGRRSA